MTCEWKAAATDLASKLEPPAFPGIDKALPFALLYSRHGGCPCRRSKTCDIQDSCHAMRLRHARCKQGRCDQGIQRRRTKRATMRKEARLACFWDTSAQRAKGRGLSEQGLQTKRPHYPETPAILMSPVGANSTISPRPGGPAAGRLSALDDPRNIREFGQSVKASGKRTRKQPDWEKCGKPPTRATLNLGLARMCDFPRKRSAASMLRNASPKLNVRNATDMGTLRETPGGFKGLSQGKRSC